MQRHAVHGAKGTPVEVFAAFLKMGLTGFGGPVAHLGYFRDEFVTRRGWLSDAAYADLVALCQFLPGPASSQVGFALGLMRAGWLGALAAFVAFTLPSALAMMGLALTAASVSGVGFSGAVQGLKIVAVAIVAQAVWGMARTLCPDGPRAATAVGAVALLAVLPGWAGMAGAIFAGAVAGLWLGRGAARGAAADLAVPVSHGQAWLALAAFGVLLVGLPLLAGQWQGIAVLDGFYRAGALVFGGGHVVLPLLQAEVVAPGWISADSFMAGYGAAQAMPGPLFSVAAYLGAVLGPAPNGLTGAMLALLGLFLPGFLILIAALPYWSRLRADPRAQSALQGANAAVVGILGAALYDPVFSTAIHGLQDLALALAGFLALTLFGARPWLVVLAAAMAGWVLALLG